MGAKDNSHAGSRAKTSLSQSSSAAEVSLTVWYPENAASKQTLASGQRRS